MLSCYKNIVEEAVLLCGIVWPVRAVYLCSACSAICLSAIVIVTCSCTHVCCFCAILMHSASSHSSQPW